MDCTEIKKNNAIHLQFVCIQESYLSADYNHGGLNWFLTKEELLEARDCGGELHLTTDDVPLSNGYMNVVVKTLTGKDISLAVAGVSFISPFTFISHDTFHQLTPVTA